MKTKIVNSFSGICCFTAFNCVIMIISFNLSIGLFIIGPISVCSDICPNTASVTAYFHQYLVNHTRPRSDDGNLEPFEMNLKQKD